MSYSEDKIKESIKGNVYGASYCKYLLLRLELVTAEHDSIKEFNASSVEHVLPQKPEDSGYWADNHNLSEIDQYVNELGNLVLLSKSKNSSAKNYDFQTKKNKYLQGRVSDYPRSVQVLKYEAWTKDVIQDRTSQAINDVLSDP